MRKLIGRVAVLVLPVKEAQAAQQRSHCVAGCGGDGLRIYPSVKPGAKLPCC